MDILKGAQLLAERIGTREIPEQDVPDEIPGALPIYQWVGVEPPQRDELT